MGSMSLKMLWKSFFSRNVSSSSQKAEVDLAQSFQIRRPRAQARQEDGVSLTLLLDGQEHICEIKNFSLGGVAFVEPEFHSHSYGQKIKARLVIGGYAYDVLLEVRYVRGKRLGTQFVDPSPELLRQIKELFNFRFLAADLRRVNPDVLNRPSDGSQPNWFTDGRGNEVFFYSREGRILRLSAVIDDFVLEAFPPARVRVGRRILNPMVGASQLGSELVEWDNGAMGSMVVLELFRQLVRDLPYLSEDERRQCLAIIGD